MDRRWLSQNKCRSLRRKIYSRAHLPDDFLSGMAKKHSTHSFLGKAAQGVYLRQVRFIMEYCEALFQKPASEIKALDWGCGKGHISYLLGKNGFSTVSCDIGSQSSDSSFGQPTPVLKDQGIRVVPLEKEAELPFKDGTFDLAVSFGVLEHVARDEASLAEIRRILKPGGIFFITFLPYKLSWTQWVARRRGDHYHDRLYTVRSLRRLAEKTGWNVVDVWFGQLFPKNSLSYPAPNIFERLDRLLTDFTPLKYFATNLEAVLVRPDT
jgi:SAM-dependent methyltransferase